ncbi:MAG: 50S ribosomal protein L18 [Caldiserica bacterium]|nr:MAG: 50S ribosomal protein L18 [Caldisericota bacterium]
MKTSKVLKRKKRHLRIRKKIIGTPAKPRLVVYRSLRHIYAILVDDIEKKGPITSASSLSKEIRERIKGKKKKEIAREVGKLIAQKAISLGINEIVFDRAGYKYHGRVKEVAEGAREGGLKF